MIPDWAAERRRMVETQLRRRGIHDERVLRAMREIPREEFVPAESRMAACQDEPIPIGHGQTISQPFIVAFMTEQLEPKPADRVLEIGPGLGPLTELITTAYFSPESAIVKLSGAMLGGITLLE